MQSMNNTEQLHQQRSAFPWLYLCSESDITTACDMNIQSLMEEGESRRLFANIFPMRGTVPILTDGFITAIQCDGEILQLAEPVPAPEQADLLTDLLKGLLAQLPITLRLRFREAWATGPASTLAELASHFPQCTVVCVQQCRFTALIEEALRTGDLPAAAATLKETIAILQNSLRTELESASRKTLKSLTTLVVGQHNVAKQLVEVAKEEPYDELWQRWNSYTRHYCSCVGVAHEDVTASLAHDLYQGAPLITVRCEDAEMAYGFQYVRREMLVMTPLTHEAYRTSFCALEQGTVLACGPAGSGKTETQKDFAEWVLGYAAIVINCSEVLEQGSATGLLQAMKALPRTYFIFDELNRCQADVLSTILRGAVSHGVARQLNVAFTLNPGCSGRTPIPEVGGLGPTIPMTIPDFGAIVEVMLAVEGVRDYNAMGHAFTTFFEWCRESLSKQNHYDFGLRALKATVTITGKMVRTSLDRDEAMIATAALRSSMMAGFTPSDAALAEAQIKALFTDGSAQTTASSLDETPATVRDVVEDACDDPAMQGKLAQFLERLETRHGVGVLTEEPRAVLQALSSVAPRVGAQLVYIGADGLSGEQFFGRATESGEWRDGSFAAAVRRASRQEGDGFTWLVVDGAMDASKMEPLNPLLDDNKTLVLASNEIIPLGRNVRVVFVVGNDSTALMSPANVSRLGWVNFDLSPVSKSWFW